MAHYVTTADLTDKALKDLVTEDYLNLADKDIETLAKRNGVAIEDIEIDPLHPLLVDLFAAYLYVRICRDNSGMNPQAYGMGAEVDIYSAKLKQYRSEISRIEGTMTPEILTGEADTPQEFAGSIEVFRG